ncbi:tellurite resistance/C4-dicarboxylate transporter family protein [Roseicella frigidaeris]|uniref:C4-dicarboxylate ABC transporter n=1 Tax=Roseicella frigidaeris TaxID=2230885 RepID=A0A327M1Q6_9PROT|nr:tellurite resistance/C4-dicarboxylate transporter family protein [Roseicella frigidaeris]RAI56073.1 C4-dicarboxylate ABC transporter [Roseicella frigidaeris]
MPDQKPTTVPLVPATTPGREEPSGPPGSRPPDGRGPGKAGWDWLATFPPGYFALVMATGIVSTATHLLGVPLVPGALFAVNLAAYPVLWVITLARLVRFPAAFFRDMGDHAAGPTFLAKVAATGVLGTQFALMTPYRGIALALWVLAALLWLVLTYALLAAVTLADPKPPIERALGGAWLLVVVSTESICVLGTAVADVTPRPDVVAFACLCAFLLGGLSYVILITLIAYRWLFHHMTAEALAPPYWINMGAAAITALAGASLTLYTRAHADGAVSPELLQVLPVLTAGAWAAATWWILPLAAAAVWRHAVRRLPLAYDPQHWSVVFPLGMYAAATATYAQAAGHDFLMPLARLFAWAALAAWLAAGAGLLLRWARHAPRLCGRALDRADAR